MLRERRLLVLYENAGGKAKAKAMRVKHLQGCTFFMSAYERVLRDENSLDCN